MKYIVAVVIILLVAGGVFLIAGKKSPTQPKQVATNTCVAKQFNLNSTGNCVSDIQTMVNFMETDGLTQCPFAGSKALSISGTYDADTQNQVKVVQTWFNCYNKEEGQSAANTVDGIVGVATWHELCTYAYKYPSQANQGVSPYLKESIAAGKDAGC